MKLAAEVSPPLRNPYCISAATTAKNVTWKTNPIIKFLLKYRTEHRTHTKTINKIKIADARSNLSKNRYLNDSGVSHV